MNSMTTTDAESYYNMPNADGIINILLITLGYLCIVNLLTYRYANCKVSNMIKNREIYLFFCFYFWFNRNINDIPSTVFR